MARLPAVMMTSAELCRQWKARASAYGWAFPSDWHVPAVDAVCDAVTADADVWAAAERLGRDRAGAGVSLAEALVDVDGLATIAHARYTDPLRRAVSLGWADRISAPPASVEDPLSGLNTPEYLRVRLGELYRAAEVSGTSVDTESALVVVRLNLDGQRGWQRTLPMILVADAMRQVFDGGQSLVLLGESVAVVLCDRDVMLARRARLLCNFINRQIEIDPQVAIPGPSVWIETLPTTYGPAMDLIAELGR